MNAIEPHSWEINIVSGNGFIGAIRQEAITWANKIIDPELCRHVVLLDLNVLNIMHSAFEIEVMTILLHILMHTFTPPCQQHSTKNQGYCM